MTTTSNTVLWTVTHLLAALNLGFGLMLYLDPDYYTARETAPLECGILTTSREDNHLDPVTIFFFQGEGSVKTALAIFTLVVSKLVVASGYATSQQATELCAACFLALLLPAIPIWNLNTDPAQANIFDASKYMESIFMASAFCSILAIALFQSSRQENKPHDKVKLTTVQKISVFFMSMGVLFGVRLLWNPEVNFGPNGIQPFFTATDYDNNAFDPVMMYAGRMFGAAHMPFLVAMWYSRIYPMLVFTLILTITPLFYPLDLVSAFGDGIMYRPMWIFVTIIHTACLVINYKAAATTAKLSSKKKKE